MKGNPGTYKTEPASHPPGSVPLEASPEQARLPEIRLAEIQELKAENARLLRLVGELLVANQQLRERGSS